MTASAAVMTKRHPVGNRYSEGYQRPELRRIVRAQAEATASPMLPGVEGDDETPATPCAAS
jgi:hypothetical protein